jgi:hypothetical protein
MISNQILKLPAAYAVQHLFNHEYFILIFPSIEYHVEKHVGNKSAFQKHTTGSDVLVIRTPALMLLMYAITTLT